MMLRSLALAVLAALVVLSLAGAAAARTYYAVVGPGMTIAFRNAAGKKVSTIPVGDHTVKVRDKSSYHSFHLKGPGINRRTTIGFVGTRTWHLHFAGGTFRYHCDAHPKSMRGSFIAR